MRSKRVLELMLEDAGEFGLLEMNFTEKERQVVETIPRLHIEVTEEGRIYRLPKTEKEFGDE